MEAYISSKCLYIKVLSLIVMSRSRKVAYLPECFTLSSSSLGYMLWNLNNSLPFIMAQSSSINFTVPGYDICVLLVMQEKLFLTYCISKKYKNKYAQNGAGSIPIGMPINTKLPVVKNQFLITNETTCFRLWCVKNYLSSLLDVSGHT